MLVRVTGVVVMSGVVSGEWAADTSQDGGDGRQCDRPMGQVEFVDAVESRGQTELADAVELEVVGYDIVDGDGGVGISASGVGGVVGRRRRARVGLKYGVCVGWCVCRCRMRSRIGSGDGVGDGD